jgi:alkylation response protein AidB-like acyl-CoA dehydrogenase
MDFAYSQDEQAFADSARALFADHCGDDALRAHDAGNAPFMQALWAGCVATGLHAVVVPESAGGLGLGATALAAVLEQQGRALALVPLAEHQLSAAALHLFAPRLAPHALPEAMSGQALLSLSLDALAAAHGVGLAAQQDKDVLVVNGMVRALPLAAESRLVLLPVRMEGALRLLALPTQGPGLECVTGRSQRHLSVADMFVRAARVPAEHLLAEGALPWLQPRMVAALAAQQLGVCTAQLARTVDYVSQRQQFGRVIGTFQMVQQQLADGQIAVEALRAALAQLLYRVDAGLGCAPQAMALKVLAARAGHLVGHAGQHVHGGMGVDLTYPIHRFLYWNRALANSLGGSEPALEMLGQWLAEHDTLGWKYDLPEDGGAAHAV